MFLSSMTYGDGSTDTGNDLSQEPQQSVVMYEVVSGIVQDVPSRDDLTAGLPLVLAKTSIFHALIVLTDHLALG